MLRRGKRPEVRPATRPHFKRPRHYEDVVLGGGTYRFTPLRRYSRQLEERFEEWWDGGKERKDMYPPFILVLTGKHGIVDDMPPWQAGPKFFTRLMTPLMELDREVYYCECYLMYNVQSSLLLFAYFVYNMLMDLWTLNGT